MVGITGKRKSGAIGRGSRDRDVMQKAMLGIGVKTNVWPALIRLSIAA